MQQQGRDSLRDSARVYILQSIYLTRYITHYLLRLTKMVYDIYHSGEGMRISTRQTNSAQMPIRKKLSSLKNHRTSAAKRPIVGLTKRKSPKTFQQVSGPFRYAGHTFLTSVPGSIFQFGLTRSPRHPPSWCDAWCVSYASASPPPEFPPSHPPIRGQ